MVHVGVSLFQQNLILFAILDGGAGLVEIYMNF